MSFEKTGKVVAFEWAQGTKGQYMKATLQVDGDTPRVQNIFDEAMQRTVETAYQGGLPIKWVLDKPDGAKYWNLTSLVVDVPGETRTPQEPPGAPVPAPSGTGAPLSTAEAIARAVALKAAVEFITERGDTDDVLVTANYFLPFLLGQPPKDTNPPQ